MAQDATAAEVEIRASRSPRRTIMLVGAILVVEAVVIVGAMTFLGGPPEVEATPPPATLQIPEEEKIVEILVIDAKLPNNKTGVTYLYDAEIYVQVKMKHADQVASELEQFRNEIKSEITAIWRTSDPRDFQEPRLTSLTRRVKSLLSDRFGVDPGRGEPIISKCVIVMGTGFRIDS
ncbi:MAG: hypothetical protein ACYS0G_07115 [Planctomycetota bacterium]|jgi:hypothetical protein